MQKKQMSKLHLWLLPLAVSFTWYGGQMGSGTASGANHMNYFVRFGWYGVIFAGVALLFELWYYYWTMELSRTTGIYKSSTFLREVFHPYDKILMPIYDVLALSAFTVSTGSCMAGCAEVLNSYWSVNYMLSLAIIFVAFMVIAWFGMKAIRAVGSALTICMVAIVILVIVVGLPANWDNIVYNWTNRTVGEGPKYGSLGWAIWYVILFAALQTQVLSTIAPACEGMINKKSDSLKASLVGFICLFITMVPLSLLLLGRWPGNLNGTSIFLLEAVQNLPAGGLIKILYPILLVCAFITTGPNYIFNQTERWSEAKFWTKITKEDSFFRKMNVRKFIVMVIYVGISFLLAVKGFGFVTNTLMPALSYGWLITLVAFGIAVPVKVCAYRRALKNGKAIVTAEQRRTSAN